MDESRYYNNSGHYLTRRLIYLDCYAYVYIIFLYVGIKFTINTHYATFNTPIREFRLVYSRMVSCPNGS